SNLVQTCAISEYDLGGEGDLFKAPRPILEESVLAFDPIAAATLLLSGYGSSITTDNIEIVDMESIQNGDLLCEAFYGCEKDLLVKSAHVPAPDVADFVLPSLQLEETIVGERNCFSAEMPLQKRDSTNASSVGPCLLDVHEVDLEAAFGMRTYSEGDIQAQRNRETTFLRLEFHVGGAGDEGGLDLSQESFFYSGVCHGEVSSLHGLPHGAYGSSGGSRPQDGWLGSDICPSYLMVQLFFLDMREGNHCHKSVWLSRLYFSSDLRLWAIDKST
ncbi:hypothetical protein BHE74_00030564, partial [Ensete ventricosum]